VEEFFLVLGERCSSLKGLDLLDELPDLLESTVYGGEPHIGHRINGMKPDHDLGSDGLRGNFPILARLKIIEDGIDRLFHEIDGDGAFLAGFDETREELLAIEWLSPSITLYGKKFYAFNLLIRCETGITSEAFPPTSDACAILGKS
jgi:hypothetical protein